MTGSTKEKFTKEQLKILDMCRKEISRMQHLLEDVESGRLDFEVLEKRITKSAAWGGNKN